MCVLDLFNFLERTFAGEHDQGAAKVAGKFHAGGAGDGHLGRGMNRKIGRELPDEPANARVLHNDRINTRRNHRSQIFFGIGKLVLEDERVEGDITAHAAPVEEGHQLRQIGPGKIVRPHSRIEFFKAEINRVRAVFDSGTGAIPIAGGRKQLRQTSNFELRILPGRRFRLGGGAHFGRWNLTRRLNAAKPQPKRSAAVPGCSNVRWKEGW